MKLERQEQIAVINFCILKNIKFFAIPNEATVIRSRNGKLDMKYHAYFKSLGVVKGAPDLVLFYNSKVLFLEMKSKKGKISESQQNFMDVCNSENVPYYVAHGFDEAKEIILDNLINGAMLC